MNRKIIDKLMFKATRVKYTRLLCLRHYLAHWPDAFVCWIDLSPSVAPLQHLSSCLLEQTVPLFLQQCLHVVFQDVHAVAVFLSYTLRWILGVVLPWTEVHTIMPSWTLYSASTMVSISWDCLEDTQVTLSATLAHVSDFRASRA